MNKLARWLRIRGWQKRYVTLVSATREEPVARIKAHLKNLDGYWLRWLGFCRLHKVPPRSITDYALFLVVEAASKVAQTDVLRLEVNGASGFRRAWMEYNESFQKLKRCSTEEIKAEAEKAYLKFKACSELFVKDFTRLE